MTLQTHDAVSPGQPMHWSLPSASPHNKATQSGVRNQRVRHHGSFSVEIQAFP